MDIGQVQKAVAQLQRQGETASVRKVHAITGGSFRDVARLLKEISEDSNTNQPKQKAYTCPRYPELRIRSRIKFADGYYETSDPEEQALIERNDWYGVFIFQS